MCPTAVIALNRAIAISQLEGPERGLLELDSIVDRKRLAAYPFYPAALADLELRAGRRDDACRHFREALALARNPAERQFFEQRLASCM
ncbi:MAG TPA: hypothetical protein VGJ84_14320 [Polyangiaceae bacterium]|jgi:RNA polymerase sigma-70 factor (ECF subfamily)